jgi:hypothetical protein
VNAESPVEAPRPASPPPAVSPAPPQVTAVEELKFTLNLRDGSHLVCSMVADAKFPVQTDFGKVELPLKLIKMVQFNDDKETTSVLLHNGDRLSGGLELRELAVQTSFGAFSIPTAVVVRCESSSAPPQVDPKTETAAQISTKDAAASILKESDDENGWRNVPEFLRGARIYDQWTRGNAGMIEFDVAQSGVVYLACHFGYEGNSSGGWREQALTEEQFAERGWKRVAEMRAGNGRVFTILRKPCGAGEHFLLRCNKYTPPLVTLLPRADEQASK